MVEAVQHYTAYRPRPFTPDERKDVTVLFGGLTWKHERLIQGTFENMGYKAQPLPNIGRPDLDAGKELIDTGACCPTIFTTGSLVRFLKIKAETEGVDAVAKKYIFLTAGACGPCRFGQYHESYTMALDALGLRDFRLFLLDQTNLDQGSGNGGGLKINLPFSLGTVWAILVGDLLTDMEYATRPYEIVPGATDRVLQESIDFLYDVFRNRSKHDSKLGAIAWHLLTDYFTKALREVKKKWDAIEVDRLRVKARIKITGEFWLQTHEGEGNYNIKRWLENEGAEIIPPPVAVWLDYLIDLQLTRLGDKLAAGDKTVNRAIRLVKVTRHIYHWMYNRLRKALGNLPSELPDQEELRRLAAPYYSFRLDGGEGHMLVGKALYAHLGKHAHMTCELSPYSCMPNTMSIGAMANVVGKYPDLLYAPVEVKGDAEVHALSRCQMVLTEAKKRAHKEFEDTLAKTGHTIESARKAAEAHKRIRCATYLVPHDGVAGTAANALFHLGREK
jgi:predicted nucleotide-binding protein (sugar kinase/HSP70/actin superfamily)